MEDLLAFLKEHHLPIPAELATTPIRVLIVDDEPGITQMLSRAVKTAHPEFEVLEANDGFRAGAMVATLKPDVVILDLRMPGIDGFEVCRLIKSNETMKSCEILAMTAHPSAENERRIVDCGARVCLSKPLDLPRLLKEIEASI